MAGGKTSRAAVWVMAAAVAALFLGMILLGILALPFLLGMAPTRTWLDRLLLLAGAVGLVALGVVLALIGLAVYVLAPALFHQERARLDYGSHRVILACTLLAVIGGNLLAALYFIPAALLMPRGALGGGSFELVGRLLTPTSIAVAAVSLDVALLAVVYLRVVRSGAIGWEAMGLSLRRRREGLLLGLLFGGLLFAVGSLLELLLDQVGIHQTQNAIFQSVRRATPGEFGLVLLAGAVVAPIVEEIYFRGYVFRAYLDQKGLWQAFLFGPALFAVVHANLPALLPLFFMGLLLSLLYHRTGSIVPPVIAHSINNAAAFTLLYLGLV